MFGELLLYGARSPEEFALVLGDGLKDLREHQLRCRLLLILAVVMLYLALVVAGEPVDAVRIAQFSDGLGEYLLVGNATAHVHLARHLDTEVTAGPVARG